MRHSLTGGSSSYLFEQQFILTSIVTLFRIPTPGNGTVPETKPGDHKAGTPPQAVSAFTPISNRTHARRQRQQVALIVTMPSHTVVSNKHHSAVVLAASIAVLLPLTGLGQSTNGGALRNWAGAGNGNFQNAPNWGGATFVPDFSDGEAGTTGLSQPAGTDSLFFDNSVNTTINLNAPNANNTGTTFYTLRSIAFGENAGAFTFQTNNTRSFVLGDSTDSLANPDNTGNIVNESTSTQTFDVPIKFRFGTVDAAEGQIVFRQAVNIGNDLSTAANNLTIIGSSDIPNRSIVTISGPLQGTGTDSSLGGHLIKEGTGTLVLSGNNSAWGGRILVNAGTVEVGSENALGSAAGRTVIGGEASTGQIVFSKPVGDATTIAEPIYLGGRTNSNAPHLSTSAGEFHLTGAITLDEGGTDYGFQSNGGLLSVAGSIAYGTATGATNIRLSGASDGIISSSIGTGGLEISIIKEGSGTWTLSGANAYVGSTEVKTGRLNITTAATGGGDISVGDLATLGINLGATGQTLNASSITLGVTTGGGTLAIDLGNFGLPTLSLIATPELTVNGTNTITLKGTGLSVGSFPILDYTGSIHGSGFAGLSLSGLPPRVTATLQNDVANTRVLLNVTGFEVPRWTGAVNGLWDINNSTDPSTGSGTVNWQETNSGTATRYLQSAGVIDSVIFNDQASGITDVTLAAALTPVTATVDNNTKTYTFSGPGKLSGGTNLIKLGTGTLILSNTGGNDYTGTTTINGGTVRIGDGVTVGGGNFGTGSAINNATIVLDRPAGDNYAVLSDISGTGTITKLGDNTAVLAGANTFDGSITVATGTLKLGSNSALGSAVAGTTIQAGAALDVGDFNAPAGEVITIQGNGPGLVPGGALVSSGPTGGTAAGLHNLALAGNAAIGGTRRFDIRDGSLAGGGFSLTKLGTNTIFLANLGDTQLGNVTIESGRLSLEGTTSLSSQPGSIHITTTGELGFEGSTVPQSKRVEIDGGKIVFNSGVLNAISGDLALSSIAPNTFQGPISAAATLTLSGSVTGGGNVTKTQDGTLVLSGANSYSGGTFIGGGAVHFLTPQSVPSTGQIVLGTNTTVGLGFVIDQNFLQSNIPATPNPATIALGTDNANNLDFTAYSAASLGAFGNVTYTGLLTPYSTSSGGAYGLGGGGGTLTVTSALTGNNALNIGMTGSTGTVIISGPNTFTGAVTLGVGSKLVLNNPSALGDQRNGLTTNGTIDLNGNSLTVGRLASAQTPTTVLVTDDSATPGNSSVVVNITSGSSTFGGTISDGVNGRKLSFTKAGAGTLVLNGANSGQYTGGTTISGGRLDVRTNNAQVLPSGGNVDFLGTATLSASNNSNNAASLILGNVSLQSGEGTIESNNFNNGTGSQSTALPAVPVRSAGATGNFTLANNTVPSALPGPDRYRVTFASAPATGQSLNGGLFFGGDNFAAYDTGGYVRPLNYATDSNTFNATLTEDQPGFGAGVEGKDVQLTGGGFSITNQPTTAIRTLRLSGASNVTLNAGAVLTITGGGLLKAGGTSAVIAGGDGLSSGGVSDLVVRTATSADSLTISTNIAATTTGGLTKSGPGSLTLSGTSNQFTGGVWINGGTLKFSALESIPATGDIRLGQGTTASFGHVFDQAFLASRVPAIGQAATIALGIDNNSNLDFSASGLNYSSISLGSTGVFTYGGSLTPFGNTYRLGGGGGTITVATPLSGENSLIAGGGGSGGVVVLPVANTYTGGTTVAAGTLRLGNAQALGSGTGDFTINGGTLDVRTFDQTLINLSGSGGTITDNFAGTGTTIITANILTGATTFSGSINNGTGGRAIRLVKTGPGTLILSKANGHNYTGDTFINDGRLEIRTNNLQVLPNGSNVTIKGNATLAAVNNGAATVTDADLNLGTLNLLAGDGTIESNQLNASTTNRLAFATVPTRSPGATGNFTLTVASDPSLYRTVFTNAPTVGQSLDGGLFYNFSNFLAYDAGGFTRALRYTGTPDANAADVALTSDALTLGTGLTGKDVQLGGGSFSVTSQGSESLRTLKITGANNLNLANNETLTLSAGGLLKTGNNPSTISGGLGLTTNGASDLVVRTDLPADVLTLATPILPSTLGGLTKTGEGSLVLTGNNSYLGGTYVNSGALLVNGSINGTTSVFVSANATLGGNGTITTNNGDVNVNAGGILSPGTSVGELTFSLGTGTLNLAAALGGVGSLKFELGAVSASDLITLTSGTLNIGTGVLSFDDFAFTPIIGIESGGIYTLFSTNTAIAGTLNSEALSGFIAGLPATLEFADGGSDLVLAVVPEPGSSALLLGSFGLLAGLHRHRNRPRVSKSTNLV